MRIVFAEPRRFNDVVNVGSHHYAKLFASHGHRVAWVTTPVSVFHLLRCGLFWDEHRYRFATWLRGGLQAGEVFQYCPFTLLPYKDYPVLRSDLVFRNQVRLSVPRVRGILARRGFFRPDVLWLAAPWLAPLVEELSPRLTVYRIADDNAAFDGVPVAVRRHEERLIRDADIVVSSSRRQLERVWRIRGDGIYLPNGVELENFTPTLPRPEEYQTLEGPKAVYVGALDYWFDVGLVSLVARQLREWHFVLVGPRRTDLRVLDHLPNVHILGPRPYPEVPAYLQWADVGIIPFRRLEVIESVSPIKAYEYLACGLPVVSTKWAELEATGLPVCLADSPEAFAEALQTSLAKTDPSERAYRLDVARQNTWQERYKLVLKAIQEADHRVKSEGRAGNGKYLQLGTYL